MQYLFVATVLVLTTCASATDQDQDAYCTYIVLQAEAQKVFLRTPSIETGLSQQPISTGTPQTYAGLTNSLSGDRKAGLVVKAAEKNCALYRATFDAKQRVQFDLARIHKQALQNRVELDQKAIDEINMMISDMQTLVAAQNMTVPNLYALRGARARWEADKGNTQLLLATLYIPDLSISPLREILATKQELESEHQKARDNVAKQDNWDIELSVGLHHNVLTPFQHAPNAYGGFRFTYSLGSKVRDVALDKAAAAYGRYKQVQQDDVIYMAGILKQEVIKSITTQETALRTLHEEEEQISRGLVRLSGTDTNAAIAFGNQLNVEKMSLGIEIGTTEFRIAQLQEYLQDNF